VEEGLEEREGEEGEAEVGVAVGLESSRKWSNRLSRGSSGGICMREHL